MAVPARSRRYTAALLAGCLAGAILTSCGPRESGAPAAGDAVTIAAVGDIACSKPPDNRTNRCRYDAVGKLVTQGDYDAFLALGDLQYLKGGYDNFVRYYDRYFGSVKSITRPVPGNHETYTPNMAGYMKYFGDIVHTKGDYLTNAGFYSYDLGSWHMVALNSQLCRGTTYDYSTGGRMPIARNPNVIPGCGPGDSMYEWLKADLAQHPARCTLVYYHHPLLVRNPYVEGPFWPGPFYYSMIPLWELMDANGVDVVLNGHYHNYQRFGPQDAYGRPVPNGITEFIAGMGGSTHDYFKKSFTPPAAYEAGTDTSFGILQMTLRDGGYDYKFVPAAGEPPYQDEGSGTCR
jgi:acid phosphatase type 7